MSPSLVFPLMAALLVAVGVLATVAERRRRRRLAEFFQARAWTLEFTRDPAARAAAFRPFVGLSSLLKTGDRGIKWNARLSLNGLSLCVIEHSYTTGAGKSQSTHVHTVGAVKCPQSWPRVTLTRENLFTRIGTALGMTDLDLENPEFNRRWRVDADDENFALAAISPQVQELLASDGGESSEAWRLGSGLLAVSVARRLGPERIGRLLDRFGEFVDAMEPVMRDQLIACDPAPSHTDPD